MAGNSKGPPVGRPKFNDPKQFPRLPGESDDAYEARFVMTLTPTELKQMLMVCGKKIKDCVKQSRIITREIKARGLK